MAEETLFPKIVGSHQNFLFCIKRQVEKMETPVTTLAFTGTVKLHGTHADILVQDNENIILGSRNRLGLTVEQDNYGFAAFCADPVRKIAVVSLTAAVKVRWAELHEINFPPEAPVLLAGEWIGQGIQKKVAISGLQPRFVLCGIRVGDEWEHIENYTEIDDESHGLYNINRGGVFRETLDLTDEGDAFFARALELTKQVAGRCPFAATFGIEGVGEGIVWTLSDGEGLPNSPELWLKTKSEQFMVRTSRAPASDNRKPQMPDAAAQSFVSECCTPPRMEQAMQYLDEMCIWDENKRVQEYLRWLIRDIEVEEGHDIEKENMMINWKKLVGKIAVPWYMARKAENQIAES